MKRYLQIIGAVLTAVLLVLAGAKVASRKSAAKKKEAKAEELLNSGISKNIQKAKKLTEAANKDKDKAIAAKQKMEQRLEILGAQDETLDDIADRFNSRRLRKQPGRVS